MNSELTRTEIEECRAALHRLVDEHFDLALQSLKTGEPLPQMETVLPLSTDPRRFKGTKPAVIIFPDGRRVKATKWRTAVTLILQDCANTPPYGERLMSMRGWIMGRQRTFLDANPDGMDVPLEIRPGLFMEGKFDTEALLYTLTKRIFDPVGYNYRGISVQLRQKERR